jgi:predicted nucleic acid-binding protein
MAKFAKFSSGFMAQGRGDNQPPEVATRFAQCFVGEVVISAITLAELEYGVVCSAEKQ